MIALVLGGANCVYADVEAALNLGEFRAVVAANHIGIHWPGRLDAWASIHEDKLKRPWIERRRRRGHPEPVLLVGPSDLTYRWPGQTKPGSSGLFALKVALDVLGCDRAVLCGIPLEPEAEHFNIAGAWTPAEGYRAGWVQALPHIRDRARSMSGWTERTLGRATPAWIAGD